MTALAALIFVAACNEHSTTEPVDATSPTLSGGFATARQDPFTVREAIIIGDALILQVEYGGGCGEHLFALHLSDVFRESNPVQAGALVSHNAHGDMCRALVRETLTFDLTPLKQTWQQAYRRTSGSILLGVGHRSYEGPESTRLLYTFDK
jgi:hypothetical protein